MIINVINEQSQITIDSHQVEEIIKNVLLQEAETADEVSVNLISKEAICLLHEKYFNDPTPTDCISFPMDDADELPYRILGDIFVCPEVAIEYANQHCEDPLMELTLYIVHGLLHLLGYDDIEEEDQILMRQAEADNMLLLKQNALILKR